MQMTGDFVICGGDEQGLKGVFVFSLHGIYLRDMVILFTAGFSGGPFMLWIELNDDCFWS